MVNQTIIVGLLLFAVALGYLAVRRAADLTHWGQYVSMLCVVALAGVAIPSRQPVEYVSRKHEVPRLTSTDEKVFAAIQQNFVALRQQRENHE